MNKNQDVEFPLEKKKRRKKTPPQKKTQTNNQLKKIHYLKTYYQSDVGGAT